MKLLAVLVSIIAVIAVNGQAFPDDGPKDSAKQIQLLNKSALAAVDDIEVQEKLQNLNKISAEEAGFNYWTKVNPRAQGESCTNASGECMPKKTIIKNCNGKIDTNKKCDNKKESCCITEINQCVAEVGLMKETINEGNDNITSAIDIKVNTLDSKMDNRTKELEDKTDRIIQQLNLIIGRLSDCPEGFFRLNQSNTCYKLFTDKSRNWTEASAKCVYENLILAHPTNPIGLRRYILSTFAKYAWLNARGDATQFKWQDNNQLISNNSTYWYPSHPGSSVTTSSCLLMLSGSTSHMTNSPLKPYYAYGCANSMYALCELVY